MGIDFSSAVYLPNFDVFARPIIVTRLEVGAVPFTARGIYDTRDTAVPAEDGTIISDQQTILDIMESEFATIPRQRDRIEIPADLTVPAAGTFEVVDSSSNGGGETTLVIRKIEPNAP